MDPRVKSAFTRVCDALLPAGDDGGWVSPEPNSTGNSFNGPARGPTCGWSGQQFIGIVERHHHLQRRMPVAQGAQRTFAPFVAALISVRPRETSTASPRLYGCS
jgi:hypothetical protein